MSKYEVGHAASYGEPWKAFEGVLDYMLDNGGQIVGRFEIDKGAKRAAECVNALAGVSDPAAALADVRERLESISEECERAWAGGPGPPLLDRVTRIQQWAEAALGALGGEAKP